MKTEHYVCHKTVIDIFSQYFMFQNFTPGDDDIII